MNYRVIIIALKSVICCLFFSFFVTNTYAQNEKISFVNPILAGDNPDPSILREGEDFYMVHSSFEYYPALPIWHSRDLIHWRPLTNALEQYVGSVWAPDLVKVQDKYYIYFPANDTNYVIWAEDIMGPWSAPIHLDISMIDPGHVVDADGNRYLYFSSGSYVPLSKDGLKIAGSAVHSYDGWVIPREWSIECFCMEGPKLFKKGEYYYLTVAQGGTAGPATGHMVISARSKSPLGPWENSPYNPIIRTEKSDEKWCSVGHGTIFDDSRDNWYMVFHGYEKGYYNMGRQTLLTTVEWTADDWFKIPDGVRVDQELFIPNLIKGTPEKASISDDFNSKTLKPNWKFFKQHDASRYHFADEKLVLKGQGNGVADCSPLLVTPQDHCYMAEVTMEIEKDAIGGLVLFYNEQAYSGILADKANILGNLRGWQFVTEEGVINRKVRLRLKNMHHKVDMYYSIAGEDWVKIENSLETSAFHHNVLSGFMSLRIGICSIGDGQVKFDNFKYTPLTIDGKVMIN
ncbi:family 43 glycosylhydrolase [Persicobacter diffluens]|uniref:Xylosidase/arabinosidase n=1 Tax=Persicobacter diffluens TaxID=981 RepID=A0AAN4W3T9_9BACT|nr:xylosidase/arabinosidase [Persicobacter diffluens]